MKGTDAGQELKKRLPGTRILVVTVNEDAVSSQERD
jgi:hypothetical protein